ncbi:MAG: YhjD/YihY/BrkB family envelope integrity protein [Pseudomonadota bacterium]
MNLFGWSRSRSMAGRLDVDRVGKQLCFWLRKLGKSLVLSTRGFREDNCMLRASALTYYTLLSIVPIMAMAFGIAKGFGFEKLLEKEVMGWFAGQEEAAVRIIDFSRKILGETQGGIMAALGVIFLLWAVIKTLSHIEEALNTIWWIKKNRMLIRKFTDYLALFFTAPLILIFSGSITVFIKTNLTRIILETGMPAFVGTMASWFVKLLPYGAIWLLFTFLYLFIPNKKVDVRAALVGGVIAGTVYQTAQMIYITFQVGVSHYNAIYGSFAALPLFLIWLQASWLVLLFGAEIAFTWENSDILEQEQTRFAILSLRLKKLLALRVVMACAQRFTKGLSPASDTNISAELGIPLRVARKLLIWLKECHVLSEVVGDSGNGFQPARDLESVSILSVIKALEENGEDSMAITGGLELEALTQAMEAFEQAAKASTGERLLRDI